MTKAAEIRSWGDQELADHLDEVRTELFNLRFQVVTGQLDNYGRIGQVKREIARLETIARERQFAAAPGVWGAPRSGGAAGGPPNEETEE